MVEETIKAAEAKNLHMNGKLNAFSRFCYTPVFERFKGQIDFSQPLKDQVGRMCFLIYKEKIGSAALARFEAWAAKQKDK